MLHCVSKSKQMKTMALLSLKCFLLRWTQIKPFTYSALSLATFSQVLSNNPNILTDNSKTKRAHSSHLTRSILSLTFIQLEWLIQNDHAIATIFIPASQSPTAIWPLQMQSNIYKFIFKCLNAINALFYKANLTTERNEVAEKNDRIV